MRKKMVVGNWKMNKTFDDGSALLSEVANMANDELSNGMELIVAPPYILLSKAAQLLKESPVKLAAQNCSDQESGAYTGEISAGMLSSVGVSHVIIGHSERREYNHEDDDLLKAKVKAVLVQGLIPIYCVGESLEVRESGNFLVHLEAQLKAGLFELNEKDFKKVVVAYEPIWAIGTGKTASSDQAQEVHAHLRQAISKQFGNDIAENTSILYGGSCKPDNAQELFSQKDVDGGLIGGAALKARDFIAIAKAF